MRYYEDVIERDASFDLEALHKMDLDELLASQLIKYRNPQLQLKRRSVEPRPIPLASL